MNHALVYADADILRLCHLVDYPGYGNSDQDDRANKYEEILDVVIFISRYAGFLGQLDITWLSKVIKTLPCLETVNSNFPPLGNLFVLASHITTKKALKLDDFFKKAVRRVMNLEFALKSREEITQIPITPQAFHSTLHTFYYDEDDDSISGSFFDSLEHLLLDVMPNIMVSRFHRELESLGNECSKEIARAIKSYEQQIEELSQLEDIYSKYVKNEPGRRSEVERKKASIEQYIKEYKSRSIYEFQNAWGYLVNEASLAERIKGRYRNEKEASEYAVGDLLERAEYEIKSILEPKTQELINKTDSFLAEYKSYSDKYSVGLGSGFLVVNAAKEFAIGSAKAGLGGAFASLAMGFAGSAILTFAASGGIVAAVGAAMAKVGVVLSGMVAHIIFPIAIAAGAVALIGRLFRGPWQNVVARKVIEAISNQLVESKLRSTVEGYWDETLSAFRSGVEQVEQAWNAELGNLKQKVENPEKGLQDLEKQIANLEAAEIFFSNLHQSSSIWHGR